MGIIMLFNQGKVSRTLDTTMRNPFLHISDLWNGNKVANLSPFVSLNHSLNSMHYYEKLVCNVAIGY